MAKKIILAELDFDVQGLIKGAQASKQAILQLRQEQKELKAAGEELSPQFIRNDAELKRLTQSYNLHQKAIQSQINKDGQLVSATQALTDALNRELVTEQDVRQSNSELLTLRKRLGEDLKGLEKGTDEYNAALKDQVENIEAVNRKLDQNNKWLKANASQYEVQKMNIGNYREEIVAAFQDLNLFNGGLLGFMQRAQQAGGVTPMLTKSFSQIKEGVVGLTKSSIAFLATPIGAGIATLAAIGYGVKELWDFNSGLKEMNKQLTSLGVSKEELSGVRSEIKATADTYKQEFDRIAKSTNAVSKAFEVSFSDANDFVSKSLAGLTEKQQEFVLNSADEFSIFYANAGYTAEDFFNTVRSGIENNVEKLPDVVKEANLAIKEQTQATKDALINAFGASFSNDLLSRVRTGETTTKKALEEISAKAKEVNLDQQQQAQLTADVFKGAGEDAGGVMKVLTVIGNATTKELTSAAKASEELRQANERLNKVQSELLEVSSFGDAWAKTKAIGIDALSAFLEYFADIKKDLEPLIELISVNLVMSWNALKAAVKVVFDFISSGFKVMANTIGTVIKVISKLLKGDFKGALQAVQDGVMKFLNIFKNAFNSIKNTIISFVQDVIDSIGPLLEKFGVDIEAVRKKLDSWKSKKVELKATVKQEGPTQAEVEKKASADLKEQLQKQVDMYAQRKQRLEAMGKDSFAVEQKMLQLQLGLYEKGSKEYEAVYTNLVKLRTDQSNKFLSQEATRLKAELDLFLSTQDTKNLAVDEEIKLAEQIRVKKLAIAEAEYKASKKTSDDLKKLKTEQNKINMEYIDKQTAAVVNNAEREYQAILAANKSKLDANKFLSDEMVRQEKERIDIIANAQKDALATKMAQEKKSAEEIAAALATIDEETRKAKETLEAQKTEADNAKKLTDIENRRLSEQLTFEEDMALEKEKLDIQHAQEIEAAEKNGADTTMIDAKYAKMKVDIDKAIADNKMSLYKDAFSNIATILGQENAASKAFSVAAATIDTYQAANKALAAYPPPFSYIAAGAAVATGLGNVKKIVSTKSPKFEKGGLQMVGGNLHSNGGTQFVGSDGTSFEAERGELIGVMSRNASRHFMDFNNIFTPGASISPSSYLANGGIVSRTPVQNAPMDVSDFAAATVQAVREMPTPIVLVQDIASAGKTVVEVKDNASF